MEFREPGEHAAGNPISDDGPVSGVSAPVSLLPLHSEFRTREQMVWIHDRFTIDGLGRLARADRQYADEHGYYLPDVAALALAAILEAQRLHDALVQVLAGRRDAALKARVATGPD